MTTTVQQPNGEVSPIDNLLVELFTEELPPKSLEALGNAFAKCVFEALQTQQLLTHASVLQTFATPRRLGLHIQSVLRQAPEKSVSIKLMPAAVALNEQGQATPALLKKMHALGCGDIPITDLVRIHDGKVDVFFLQQTQTGVALQQGLQNALEQSLAKLPIPKTMAYQLGTHTDCQYPGWSTVNFIRPVHGILALHGSTVVPVAVLGLQAGRTTQGHRFESRNPTSTLLSIPHADNYVDMLHDEGRVIVSFSNRRNTIEQQLAHISHTASAKAGALLLPVKDKALLDEVTGLVEWPHVVLCQFEPEFLNVPSECLILTMKVNQKYFPLLQQTGKLSNQFLVVSNIAPTDTRFVVGGNERVVRPRLADAQFFFEQDRKRTLLSRLPMLDKVVYHNQLGTQGQRTARVQALAFQLSSLLGMDTATTTAIQTAAQLAKTDLLTDMVGEFPELQGTMGRHYALHDGCTTEVADAIEDHYKPRFAGDELPRNTVGKVVALADKLETLAGLFGTGHLPTGDKDPFALRRHALGVVRLLSESTPNNKAISVGLPAILQAAVGVFQDENAIIPTFQAKRVLVDLSTFILERLAGSLKEQGNTTHQIDAVLAMLPTHWCDIAPRLLAVATFAQLPQAPALAAANKRIGNILKKAQDSNNDNDNSATPTWRTTVKPVSMASIQSHLLTEPTELTLYQAMRTTLPQAHALFDANDNRGALQQLAGLRDTVDAFFEHVMVNVEDLAVRQNRQILLKVLFDTMNRIADLSKLI